MKLYAFDGIDSSLPLLPLAARRALDKIGAKLSLEGFLSLPLEERRRLVLAGTDRHVDEASARAAISGARPSATSCDVQVDPSSDSPPAETRDAFGDARPLSDKVWQSLSSLDRYALYKVAQKGKPERIQGAYDEIVGARAISTHLRPQGGVHMVSISEKAVTRRTALAECWIVMSSAALNHLALGTGPKGDILGVARVAGIMATKRTSDLIPLCHPLALQHVEVDVLPQTDTLSASDGSPETADGRRSVRVTCRVEIEGKTGVEMEALVGANIAALTIYDMLKSADRAMEIGPCRLVYKSGGRSGTFERSASEEPKQ